MATGAARSLIEFTRINTPTVLGLTQPQLWSVLLVTAGLVLAVWSGRRAHYLTTALPNISTPEKFSMNTP